MRSLPLLMAGFLFAPAALASTLEITSHPPGAEIRLDQTVVGYAPVVVRDVRAGEHEVRVSMDRHVARTERIAIGAGEDVKIHVPLVPAPQRVEPPPRPAKPAPASRLSDTLEPLPAASKGVRPSPAPAAGCSGGSGACRFAPGAAIGAAPSRPNTPLPVSQLPVAWGTQPKSSTLRVDTSPSGASVEVVGMPGTKPSPALFTGFARGTVRLRVSAPGYQEQTVAVDISGDVRTHVTLEKLP